MLMFWLAEYLRMWDYILIMKDIDRDRDKKFYKNLLKDLQKANDNIRNFSEKFPTDIEFWCGLKYMINDDLEKLRDNELFPSEVNYVEILLAWSKNLFSKSATEHFIPNIMRTIRTNIRIDIIRNIIKKNRKLVNTEDALLSLYEKYSIYPQYYISELTDILVIFGYDAMPRIINLSKSTPPDVFLKNIESKKLQNLIQEICNTNMKLLEFATKIGKNIPILSKYKTLLI